MDTDFNKSNIGVIFEKADTDDEKVAVLNKFNDFFASIGETLAQKLPPSSVSPTDFIPTVLQSFFLFPVSQVEISAIVSNLKITRTHVNEMPIVIFKKLVKILSYPLALLVNNSFDHGIFPDKLKIARITPIHKKGDLTLPTNYRPISSLPHINKI